MKKHIVLAAAVAALYTNVNAQAVVGTKSNVELNLLTRDTSRMTVEAAGNVVTHKRFSVQDATLTYSGGANTAAAIKITPQQNSGLVITDNLSYPAQAAALSVINSALVAGYGIRVHSYTNNADWTGLATAATVYSENGAVGYFRKAECNSTYRRVEGYSSFLSVPLNIDTNAYTSFRSYGALNGGIANTFKDFVAEDYANVSIKGTSSTRYGVYLPFTKGNMTAAWGIYQSHNSISNYFNGTSLFGTTASNNIDKAQVTGGTKTDGFAAGLYILPNNSGYTTLNTDYTILAGVGQVTVTLATSGIDVGKIFNIKKTDIPGTSVIVAGTIDGVSGYTLSAQYEGVIVQYNGTDYSIIGKY